MIMLRSALILAAGLVLSGIAWADDSNSGPVLAAQAIEILPPKPRLPVTGARKFLGKSVVMCYTCGGKYPVQVSLEPLGGFNLVFERGPKCQESAAFRLDQIPVICRSR